MRRMIACAGPTAALLLLLGLAGLLRLSATN